MALIEASIEGPIQSVTSDAGAGVVVQAMAITVHFAPGTTSSGRTKTIKTPVTTLTPAQFIDGKKFPGRAENGFVGGTIIAEGAFDTDTNTLEADFITVEPAETVILGALTANQPGPPRVLKINGCPIEMLTDDRMPSNPADPANPVFMNQYGFPMNINSATVSPNGPTPTPPPAPSSAEGYFANGVFHAFLFEYGGTGQLSVDPAVTPQVSLERASYRDRGNEFEVEARGFVTTSHVPAGSAEQSIRLFRVDRNPTTGLLVENQIPASNSNDLDIDRIEPGFERWRFRTRRTKPSGFLSGVPLLIRVKNLSGIDPATGVPAKADVEPDVREA